MNRMVIGVLISVIVLSFYISSINAQSQPPKPCVVYDSPALIILDMYCDRQYTMLASYVVQGYDIKAITETTQYKTAYLTKIP
jgi:hypothetical protein